MKNYVQPGDCITIPAPSTIDGGTLVIIGNLIGVASGDAAIGESLDLQTRGVFSYPKDSDVAFDLGDPVFFDGSELTEDSTGADLVGTCVVAAGIGVTTAYFKL